MFLSERHDRTRNISLDTRLRRGSCRVRLRYGADGHGGGGRTRVGRLCRIRDTLDIGSVPDRVWSAGRNSVSRICARARWRRMDGQYNGRYRHDAVIGCRAEVHYTSDNMGSCYVFRSVVCYEHIYHHEHPDIDDSRLNTLLDDHVFASVPLPERELARGDLKETEDVAKALHSSVESILELAGRLTVATGAVVVEELAKGDLPGVKTVISATVAASKGLVKSSLACRLLWRWRRPQLLWANDLVDQAHRLTDALPDFARIWRIPPNLQASFAQRFRRMAELAELVTD